MGTLKPTTTIHLSLICMYYTTLICVHCVYDLLSGACDVGTLKPSPVPFMAIAQRAGIPPGRILFIGTVML